MNENEKLLNDEQYRARNAKLVYQILQSNDKQNIEFAKTEFYTLNSQHIYNFIRRKLGNAGSLCDAEELTNDTFQKTFEYLHTVRNPENVLNWMFKVAYQLTAGWHRKNRKNKKRVQFESSSKVSEFDMADASIRAHQEAQQREMEDIRREKLQETIEQLPELERRMLYLQQAGKSYEEIAEELRDAFPSLKPSSVRNRLSRAKETLREWAAAWEQADAEGYDLEFSEFMENRKKKK